MRVCTVHWRAEKVYLTIVQNCPCTVVIKRLPRIDVNIDHACFIVDSGASVIDRHPHEHIRAQAAIVISVFLQIDNALVNNHVAGTVSSHSSTGIINSDYTALLVSRNTVASCATTTIRSGGHTNTVIYSRAGREVSTQRRGVVLIDPKRIQRDFPGVIRCGVINCQHTNVAAPVHVNNAAFAVKNSAFTVGLHSHHTRHAIIEYPRVCNTGCRAHIENTVLFHHFCSDRSVVHSTTATGA